MIEIRWHGRGGQGAFTAARLLGDAVVCDDKSALAFPSFGPERRGAPVLAFTRIDDAPIKDRSDVVDCDCAIAENPWTAHHKCPFIGRADSGHRADKP